MREHTCAFHAVTREMQLTLKIEIGLKSKFLKKLEMSHSKHENYKQT